MALQVDDFAPLQLSEITPLERSKPAHRVAIADSVELATKWIGARASQLRMFAAIFAWVSPSNTPSNSAAS
jgi:hypothetical protein